jgi:hypothetical protein
MSLLGELIQKLDSILYFASPDKYRNTLIEIYHIYIAHEHSSLPGNFNAMADHMYFLIDFFRRVDE